MLRAALLKVRAAICSYAAPTDALRALLLRRRRRADGRLNSPPPRTGTRFPGRNTGRRLPALRFPLDNEAQILYIVPHD